MPDQPLVDSDDEFEMPVEPSREPKALLSRLRKMGSQLPPPAADPMLEDDEDIAPLDAAEPQDAEPADETGAEPTDEEGPVAEELPAEPGDAEPVEATAVWVYCDADGCGKKRKLPVAVTAEDLPEVWTCNMNTWDERFASCDAEQEDGWDEEPPGDDSGPEDDGLEHAPGPASTASRPRRDLAYGEIDDDDDLLAMLQARREAEGDDDAGGDGDDDDASDGLSGLMDGVAGAAAGGETGDSVTDGSAKKGRKAAKAAALAAADRDAEHQRLLRDAAKRVRFGGASALPPPPPPMASLADKLRARAAQLAALIPSPIVAEPTGGDDGVVTSSEQGDDDDDDDDDDAPLELALEPPVVAPSRAAVEPPPIHAAPLPSLWCVRPPESTQDPWSCTPHAGGAIPLAPLPPLAMLPPPPPLSLSLSLRLESETTGEVGGPPSGILGRMWRAAAARDAAVATTVTPTATECPPSPGMTPVASLIEAPPSPPTAMDPSPPPAPPPVDPMITHVSPVDDHAAEAEAKQAKAERRRRRAQLELDGDGDGEADGGSMSAGDNASSESDASSDDDDDEEDAPTGEVPLSPASRMRQAAIAADYLRPSRERRRLAGAMGADGALVEDEAEMSDDGGHETDHDSAGDAEDMAQARAFLDVAAGDGAADEGRRAALHAKWAEDEDDKANRDMVDNLKKGWRKQRAQRQAGLRTGAGAGLLTDDGERILSRRRRAIDSGHAGDGDDGDDGDGEGDGNGGSPGGDDVGDDAPDDADDPAGAAERAKRRKLAAAVQTAGAAKPPTASLLRDAASQHVLGLISRRNLPSALPTWGASIHRSDADGVASMGSGSPLGHPLRLPGGLMTFIGGGATGDFCSRGAGGGGPPSLGGIGGSSNPGGGVSRPVGVASKRSFVFGRGEDSNSAMVPHGPPGANKEPEDGPVSFAGLRAAATRAPVSGTAPPGGLFSLLARRGVGERPGPAAGSEAQKLVIAIK